MRWLLSSIAAINDRWLYLGTGLLLVAGAALYVHFDMHKDDWRNAPLHLEASTRDGFDGFYSRDMYLGSAEDFDAPVWAVGGSANPNKAEFEIVFRPRSLPPTAAAPNISQRITFLVDGRRLNIWRRPRAQPDKTGWPYTVYEGTRFDLATMVAGKDVTFDFSGKRYEIAESDRAILKSLLRALERSIEARPK